jgi:hypothetical protein
MFPGFTLLDEPVDRLFYLYRDHQSSAYAISGFKDIDPGGLRYSLIKNQVSLQVQCRSVCFDSVPIFFLV